MPEKDSDKDYPEFAKLLNKYLRSKDRSASWLAKSLILSPSTVSRWINEEKRPGSFEEVGRIADVFNLNDEERRKLFESAGYGRYWDLLSYKQENELRRRLEQEVDNEETEIQPPLTDGISNSSGAEPNQSEIESVSSAPQEELPKHEYYVKEEESQLKDIDSATNIPESSMTSSSSVSVIDPTGDQTELISSSASRQKTMMSKPSQGLKWVLGGIVAIVLLVFIRWFSSGLNSPVSVAPTATAPSTPISNAVLTPTVTATLTEIITHTATSSNTAIPSSKPTQTETPTVFPISTIILNPETTPLTMPITDFPAVTVKVSSLFETTETPTSGTITEPVSIEDFIDLENKSDFVSGERTISISDTAISLFSTPDDRGWTNKTLLIGKDTWTDYEVTVSVFGIDASSQFHILIRCQSKEHCLQLVFMDSQAAWFIDNVEVPNTRYRIPTLRFPFAIIVKAQGDSISAFLGKYQIGSWSGAPYLSGKVGLHVGFSNANLQEITIEKKVDQ